MQSTPIAVVIRPPSLPVIRCLPHAQCGSLSTLLHSDMSRGKSSTLALIKKVYMSCKSLLQVRRSWDGVLPFKVPFVAVGLPCFCRTSVRNMFLCCKNRPRCRGDHKDQFATYLCFVY